jgi:hypothetical protein
VTGPEINRLNNALHFMSMQCQPRRSSLWWLTTDKGTDRQTIADIRKRIGKLQRDHDVVPYSATMFECRGGLHVHVVFVGNGEIGKRLQESKYGAVIQVERVKDHVGLARKYLAKERTPQAGYGRGHVLGGRIRGSHRLEGGGDRVRLSEPLERDAIAAGYVEPWQRTNAQRSEERKPYRLRRLYPKRAPCPAGQLFLLPEMERPVARLHEFGGGIVPRAVATEIEFHRKRRGWTQSELAGKIGRSQGQYANAMRGHDPISQSAVNRLRENLLSGARGPG